MVNNPIYEGGVIYEEIPNLRPPSPKKFDLPVLTEHGEESYVSINPTRIGLDFPTLEKCDTVSTYSSLDSWQAWCLS